MAFEYGTSKNLFVKNKAVIDIEQIRYKISVIKKELDETGNYIIINDPFELKVRTDKVLSEILEITRTQVKRLVKEGKITQNHVGQTVIVKLNG